MRLKSAAWKRIIPAAVILLAVLASYHRLLTGSSDGGFEYSAVRWGLKTFMYPRLIFNSDAIRSGVWPLWNPYTFGGSPWVSNFQSGLFHPLNLLIILFSGYSAALLQLQLAAVFFLGGLGMYFCGRGHGLTLPPALAAAIAFLGCGFFVGNASYFPQINTLAAAPWLLFFLIRIAVGKFRGSTAGGGISLAVMVFSGFPTMTFFLVLFFLAWVLGTIWLVESAPGGEKWRRSFRVITVVAAGAGLSACLLVPAFESFPLIARPDAGAESVLALDRTVVGEKSLAAGNFLSLVFPFLARQKLSDYNLWIEFRNCSIGLAGLIFTVYYLVFGKRWSRMLLIFLLLSAVLSLGFNTPVYSFLYEKIPPFGMVSHPAMDYRAVFLFFGCLGSGLGLGLFLFGEGEMKKRLWFILGGVVSVGIIVLAAILRSGVISAGAVLPGIFFWLGSLLLLAGLPLVKKVRPALLGTLVVGLALVDTAAWTNFNFATVAEDDAGWEWIKRKKKEAARLREVIHRSEFTRNAQYPSREGVKAMFWKYFSDSGNDGTRLKVFQDLMRGPGRELLTRDFRIRPVYAVRIADTDEDIARLINQGIDLSETALIHRRDIDEAGLAEKFNELSPPVEDAETSAEITFLSPNRIDYRIALSVPALVIFNEIYYPGWKLTGNEEPLPLFRADLALRGTYLPAGRHRLTMYFAPLSYYLGLIISGLTAVILILTVIRPFLIKRGASAGVGSHP